jgi:hypothetical protein
MNLECHDGKRLLAAHGKSNATSVSCNPNIVKREGEKYVKTNFINQAIRQGCPSLSTVFKIYTKS